MRRICLRTATTGLHLVLTLFLLACVGCSENHSENQGAQDAMMPTVSENPTLQAAFLVCVEQTSAELVVDNPEIQAEILQMLAVGALQTCESAVVRTCEQQLDSPACRVMLDVYSR
jgi:hypothetical protein